ncbi:MAG: ABC transporter permease [Anaerovoracaceae bacterium]|jgi:ABC-2 type transport system permease protein
MQAIFKRELKSYFNTMIGPVFVAVLLAFTSIFFVAYNLAQGYPYFSAALSNATVILMFIVPVLTMRSFAEERKLKTDQLLLTAPVSVNQIVFGKFLSMIVVLAIPCIVMIGGPLLIKIYGGGALVSDLIALAEFYLLGSAYISIGMFISSLTESQVIAAVGTIAVLLLLQLSDGMSSILPSSSFGSYVCIFVLIILAVLLIYFLTKNVYISCISGVAGVAVLTIFYFLKKSSFEGLIGTIISSLSLASRFQTIASQQFDLSAIVYYVSIIALFIFLTVQSIQKRRWS